VNGPLARSGALAWLAGALLAAPAAHAQLSVPERGHGAVSVTFQAVTDHYHLDYQGHLGSAGHITSHSAQLRMDYGVTDRLAMSFTLPFISRRYDGTFPHNPDPFNDEDHHEHIGVLDDGDYHGAWQDYGLGLRWRWLDKPWTVTPFVNWSQPTHDYVYFAHAAIGTRQKKLALGVNVGRQWGPRLYRLYTQGSYSYTFVEPVLGHDVDFSTLNLEAGWFFTPSFSVRGFAIYRKTHGGLDFPIDFPPPRNNETFLHHDQIQRIDYLNYGVGASWRLGDNWSVSANWLTTGWGENGHAIHNAVSVGVSRSF
jgi:hypothetical protein